MQLTNTSMPNQRWQIWRAANDSYILRSGNSGPWGYMVAIANASDTGSSGTLDANRGNTVPAARNYANIIDNAYLWKINPWGDGSFHFSNAANGTDWHLQKEVGHGGMSLSSNITGNQPGQKFIFNSLEKITRDAFATLNVCTMLVRSISTRTNYCSYLHHQRLLQHPQKPQSTFPTAQAVFQTQPSQVLEQASVPWLSSASSSAASSSSAAVATKSKPQQQTPPATPTCTIPRSPPAAAYLQDGTQLHLPTITPLGTLHTRSLHLQSSCQRIRSREQNSAVIRTSIRHPRILPGQTPRANRICLSSWRLSITLVDSTLGGTEGEDC